MQRNRKLWREQININYNNKCGAVFMESFKIIQVPSFPPEIFDKS